MSLQTDAETSQINLTPKLCYTSAAVVFHDEKILLVKHKKTGLWMPPGGHIEPDEYPHVAAERECFEETGVKVKAVGFLQLANSDESEFLPCPFVTNLHWVSRKNYESRQEHLKSADTATEYERETQWKKGCEQHLNYSFLCEVVESTDLSGDYKEVDDLVWVSREELETYTLNSAIRDELVAGFELVNRV